jgi:transcriptional regulator with XRE-family HTH domain
MIGTRVKELRTKIGLAQKEFSDDIKINQSTIGMIETGRREPGYDILLKFAEYFNVTTDYLLGRTDVPYDICWIEGKIPKDLKELGVEYISLSKDIKEKGLSPNAVRKLIEAITNLNSKI